VAHRDGTVRHTAALALASLGLDAVHDAQTTLSGAATARRPWRRVQALAQMAAADFPLPQLPLPLLVQVRAWRAGIRMYEARWQVMAQTIGAALGITLLMALPLLAMGYRNWAQIYYFLLVGEVVGALFALGRSLFGSRWGRVVGGATGFCLGLLAFAPVFGSLSGWQLAGGLVAGAAVTLGWELLADPAKKPSVARAVLGATIGGALGFGATALSPLRVPYLLRPGFIGAAMATDASWVSAWVVALAALQGAATGAGLAAGVAVSHELGRRFFGGSERLVPATPSERTQGEES
jgi:hypothetical protein